MSAMGSRNYLGVEWLSLLQRVRNDHASIKEINDYAKECLKAGDFLQAALSFQIWLEFTTSDQAWIGAYNAAKIFEKIGHHLDALRYFDRCIRLNPGYEPAESARANLARP